MGMEFKENADATPTNVEKCSSRCFESIPASASTNNNFNLLVSYYKLKRAAASVLKKVPPR
jgi:hypothetical protein